MAFQQAPGSETGPERGNCASIALIKAAFATFGPDAILKTVLKEGTTSVVTLRDGSVVRVSEEEERLAGNESGFTLPKVDGVVAGDPQLLAKANFVWAVMAKRRTAEIDGPDNDILDGAQLLNQGDDVRYIARLLGVGEVKVKHGHPLAFTHANGYHAVFATGEEYDDYGSPRPLGVLLHDHIGLNPFRDFASYDLALVDLTN